MAEATNVPDDLLLGVYSGNSVGALSTLGSDYGSMTYTNGANLEHAETLFDAVGSVSYAIAVDSERLYFTNYVQGTVESIPK